MAQSVTFWLILRKRRIQMLESAEEEKNILEKDKQDLTLAGKSSSPFSATVGRNSWACFSICVHASDGNMVPNACERLR